MDTTITSHVKDNRCHSTPNLLASSLHSGIPQSSPHTTLPFQLESPVRTSQPTTASPLPRTSSFNPNNFQSTSTGATPVKKRRNFTKNSSRVVRKAIFLNFHLSTSFSINHKNFKKNSPSHSTQILCYSMHLYYLYLHLVKCNIWCFYTSTASSVFVQSPHLVFFNFLKTARTRNNLLIFIIFPFNSLTKTLEVDNIENVSQELIVSHYDCTKMQDNRMYSLNKLADARFHLKICISLLRIIHFNQKKIIKQTCQQQCVLSRSMFSDTIVQCFRIRHRCMTKIVSLMT